MDRLDRGQFVETVGVAPGEEAMTGALVRAAGVVVVDRAEEIGEALRGAGSDVGDQRRHDDRAAEGLRPAGDGREKHGGGFRRRAGFRRRQRLRFRFLVHAAPCFYLRLQQLAEHTRRAGSLSEMQIRVLEAKLAYLAKATGRLGRIDWRNAFVGAIAAFILAAALPPESARALILGLLRVIGHLYGLPELPGG
jgi:hypothetical protein